MAISNVFYVRALQHKIASNKNGNLKHFEKIATWRPRYDPGESLEKRTRFGEAISNVSCVGAFKGKIASNKNGNLKHFEKIATKRPRYDPLQ